MRSPLKRKVVALKSAVASCLIYRTDMPFCQRVLCNVKGAHCCQQLSWIGLAWGPKDLWKSSGRASQITEKPRWSATLIWTQGCGTWAGRRARSSSCDWRIGKQRVSFCWPSQHFRHFFLELFVLTTDLPRTADGHPNMVLDPFRMSQGDWSLGVLLARTLADTRRHSSNLSISWCSCLALNSLKQWA